MDPYNHSTLISIKLPILDTRKFEQWKFRIQQYLQHEQYALWEVIEFGDSYKAPPEETAKDKGLAGEVSSSTKKKGRTVAITIEDMQKRKNDVKARTTLLLALPDEHQLRFSKYDSAKELWKAILKTFGENEATKKTKKNQLKQQYGNFKAEGSKTLEQTFNRDDLDTMSLDDVYNHLKVYEPEVRKRAGSNSQNMTFISTSSTISGKSEVSTIQGASTASGQVPTVSTDVAVASLSYDIVCHGYHQKDKTKAKPDKAEHEIESMEKPKVDKNQPKVNPVKVKDEAKAEELLNGPTRTHLIAVTACISGISKNLEEKQIEEEQTVKAQSWKFPICYDDDDDEEGYNSLNDNIISELPSYSAVTPTEPIDFLSMGDEHLDTISATESDEFIKSCVENLVPNPSESEGENECDVPAGFTTFSNVLFDARNVD
uniref:Uncharacterized protein n=1 Tax=Tanacetum cinerariifolium TaxID=118510 RepID=A0A6L2N3M7_TANCI|nr:hypothetical protein [Tanacetum cinerariifolium]